MMCNAGNDDELADWAAIQTATASAWKRGWAKGTLKEWGHDLLQKVLFKVPPVLCPAASQFHCQNDMLSSRVTARKEHVKSYTPFLFLVIGLLGSSNRGFLSQIVPIENIQGRKAVEGGDLCLRKTTNGVDLNRNWGYAWAQVMAHSAPRGLTVISSQGKQTCLPLDVCIL